MKSAVTIAIFLTTLARETIQVPSPSAQHGCKFWSSLAHNLTHIHEQVGDIMHMVCKNDNNTDGGGCQEMKCGGQFQQSLPIMQKDVVKFNFCFGFRLNHCDDPVSMSYFFIVPDRNVSQLGKLIHDDTYEIPGSKFQGVNTTVIVRIRMAKKDDLHIEFGIAGEVRAELLGNPIFIPKIDIFPPTLIDVIPCSAADKKKKPDPPFVPLTLCGLPENNTLWTPSPTKPPIIKSATYNKSCEVGVTMCSKNEACQRIGSSHSRNGICVCVPFTVISPATGYCESPLNPTTTEKTMLDIICETYERVLGPAPAGTPSVTGASRSKQKGQPANSTAAVPSVTKASKSQAKSISIVAIAVPCVVGGLLVIVVVVSIIVYIGKRKRAAIYRDRHQLLTQEDDDDVNLVI